MFDKDSCVADLYNAVHLLDTLSVPLTENWNKVDALALAGSLRAVATLLRSIAKELDAA